MDLLDLRRRPYTVVTGQELPDYLSAGQYREMVDAYAAMIGRPVKGPGYDTLRACLEVTQPAGQSFFSQSNPLVLWDGHAILPIVLVRDEEVHDRDVVIPTVMMETYSNDLVPLWLSRFRALEAELRLEENGYRNPVVSVDELPRIARRFGRRMKDFRVELVDAGQALRYCGEYVGSFREYWQSRNITAEITRDQSYLFGLMTGLGFDAVYGIHAVHASGDRFGIGVFTRVDDQLYWDFSRHNIGADTGNVILVKALQVARELGCRYLNLGVAYYQWKANWATRYLHHPSVRLQEGSPLHQAVYGHLLRTMSKTGADNPDRRRKPELALSA